MRCGITTAKRLRVASPQPSLVFALTFCVAVQAAHGQQAVSPIEQARLFQKTPTVANPPVNADGMALPVAASSDDDSFGEQAILKTQPRQPTFVVTGDASVFYTNNVALTRRATNDDAFFVGHVGGSWTPRISREVEAQIGASASVFRYRDTPALDFQNLSLGAGIYWSPPQLRGVGFFARYDLIELINRSGDEILQDHEFTVGAQKVFALGRSHGWTLGALGMAGVARPYAAQRDQLSVFVGYRAQLTRALSAEVFYRPSVHFYNASGRTDFNQVLSLNVRYQLARWAEATAFFSLGSNRSDESVFDYDVLNAGAGGALTVRF